MLVQQISAFLSEWLTWDLSKTLLSNIIYEQLLAAGQITTTCMKDIMNCDLAGEIITIEDM